MRGTQRVCDMPFDNLNPGRGPFSPRYIRVHARSRSLVDYISLHTQMFRKRQPETLRNECVVRYIIVRNIIVRWHHGVYLYTSKRAYTG